MQAIEASGTIDAQGQLSLDHPLQSAHPGKVRVIVLLADNERADLSDALPNGNAAHGASIAATASEDFSAHSFLSMIDEIRAQVPAAEWKKLPTDLSKNLDHYLYGAPKVEE